MTNHPPPSRFSDESAGELRIRGAAIADCPLILQFIRELAEYEKLSDKVVATVDDLRKHLFGETEQARVIIAELDRAPVGFALFFSNFSTFLGQPGLYLEDLFVRPAWRGRGIGRALLRAIAQTAQERNCGRIEWAVLDWNRPAIDFYRSLGAVQLDNWLLNRVSGDALKKLADL
jgi:GNAT superfamily N-acetyltransferase